MRHRHRYERFLFTEEFSEASREPSESLESLDSEQFDFNSNTIPDNPDKALIYQVVKSGRFDLLKSVQLSRKEFRLLLVTAFKSYIKTRLTTIGPLPSGFRPLIPKILQILKKHNLKVSIRLTAPFIEKIFDAKKHNLFRRLFKARQIVFRMTIRTPTLLWRRKPNYLINLLKMHCPWTVIRPSSKEHILKGINKSLFVKICRLNLSVWLDLEEYHKNIHNRLIEWSARENQVELFERLICGMTHSEKTKLYNRLALKIVLSKKIAKILNPRVKTGNLIDL